MSALTNFNDCVREFRQYGCDPYNTADDVAHWTRVEQARNHGTLQEACQPAKPL